eukprot:SAG11_NODE_38233_length_253_cov_0.675325_1_plen_31_part_10
MPRHIGGYHVLYDEAAVTEAAAGGGDGDDDN